MHFTIMFLLSSQSIKSEYDQEIPQLHTIVQPTAVAQW